MIRKAILGLSLAVFLHAGFVHAATGPVWEYKILKQSPDYSEGALRELNELGSEGWEVVAVVPAAFVNGNEKNSIVGTVTVYLKRVKR